MWEWQFAGPPETLWPLLADTARFNEAIGLPRYAVSETPLPDGTVRRTGRVSRCGLTVAWEEGVPEWVAPYRFAHERRFTSGPLRRVLTEINLDPDDDVASHVRYRLHLQTRWPISLLVRLVFLDRFGRRLDRLFREAAEFARAGRDDGALWAPPSPLPAAARVRLETRARALIAQGYAADRLTAHLAEAADRDLERMRPRAFARRWEIAPRQAIETFLAAARGGLLTLRWDLICPRCRGAKFAAASLDQLPQGAHCPSCNIAYDRDFARNVEVTFEPADDIRPLGAGTFCLASPIAAEHIKIQQRLAAGEAASIAVLLVDGDYRARTVEPGGASDFRVDSGVMPAITIGEGDPAVAVATHSARLEALNASARERTLVVEDRRWASDALTAHEVTTLQAFRDLFGEQVLRPGDEVEIRRVTLLFTDLKGSSDLYNRVGDACAYGWVREHFAVLARAVREHDGAVVKTIGDAVMAAFCDPADGLAAALAIREAIVAFNETLSPSSPELAGRSEAAIIVKLGLHCGPCIAVTLNDRLDYFGRTVNLAARLQGESRGGDIVLSQAMAEDPEVAAALARLAPADETALVKGFAEPIQLKRIPPQAA